jgi:hypothetical protein
MKRSRPETIESAVQILILLAIGGMAGAASFTHVHDWTMDNSPAGTHDWFGWANAVISELTPIAAGIEIRRRKRNNQGIKYPMAVLVAAATLSLSAQVAEAKTGASGWLLSAVPALAFLALSKLVLSRHTPTTKQGEPSWTAETPTAKTTSPTPAPTAGNPSTTEPAEDLPAHLITGARMAAFTHRQATGQPITAPALADHLGIPPELAGTLIHALGETGDPAEAPSPITRVNGTPVEGRL